jgi:hypothetical protein
VIEVTELSKLRSKIVGVVGGLIPETVWTTLESDLYQQVVNRLRGLDKVCIEPDIMAFIEQKKYRIGKLTQANSGAGWTVRGNITIRPDDVKRCLEPYVLSLILHEIFHVKRQSILMRLSLRGELQAWQYQYRIYPLLQPGHEIGEEYFGKSEEWQQLSKLSPSSREDLERARDLMIAIAPGYRAYALPIYPLPQELGHYVRHLDIKGIVAMLRNLVRCTRGEKVGNGSP